MTTLKGDCVFFLGDKPCKPHKETGVTCDNCDLYKPVGQKILCVLCLSAVKECKSCQMNKTKPIFVGKNCGRLYAAFVWRRLFGFSPARQVP